MRTPGAAEEGRGGAPDAGPREQDTCARDRHTDELLVAGYSSSNWRGLTGRGTWPLRPLHWRMGHLVACGEARGLCSSDHTTADLRQALSGGSGLTTDRPQPWRSQPQPRTLAAAARSGGRDRQVPRWGAGRPLQPPSPPPPPAAAARRSTACLWPAGCRAAASRAMSDDLWGFGDEPEFEDSEGEPQVEVST